MWIALTGLVAGILSAGISLVFVAAVGSAGVIACFPRRGPWRALGLVTVCFALGAGNALLRSPEQQPAAALAESVPSCEVVGRTLEEAGGLGLLAAADALECNGRRIFEGGVVFLDDVRMGAGRRFEARGWLLPLGDGSFDSARRRAGAAAAFHATSAGDAGPASPAHALAHRTREGLEDATEALGAPGALLRGLTIGDTSGLDTTTTEALRRSGLAHLLAVSGSNVAILLGAIALTLRRAAFVVRLGACATGLAAFVLVVGPDASVLRAAAMGVVALSALAGGRSTHPLHALGLGLAGVVALRPGIVHSTGLHLSAVATLGIVLWTRPLRRRMRRVPDVLALPLAATMAAQAAVAPLLVAVFGQLPIAGLPANLLALPAVAPATVLGLAAAAAGTVHAGAAGALARLAGPFAWWVLAVGERFGEPPWASLPISPRWGIFLALPLVVLAAGAVRGALSAPGA